MAKYKDSLEAYSKSIRLNRSLADVWFDLGILYESCKQTVDAIDAYQRAAEIDPSSRAGIRIARLKQSSGPAL
jgi:general transcriptional corepressor CYC8